MGAGHRHALDLEAVGHGTVRGIDVVGNVFDPLGDSGIFVGACGGKIEDFVDF